MQPIGKDEQPFLYEHQETALGLFHLTIARTSLYALLELFFVL